MEQKILNQILDKFGDGDQETSDIRHHDSGDEGDDHSDNDNNANECCDDDEHKHKDFEPDVEAMTDEQYMEYIQEKEQPKYKSGGNTGVKGVLSDYAEHREKEKQKYLQQKREAIEKLEKMCFTTRDQPEQQPEEDLDSDEEDLERIRRSRLEQWKNKQTQESKPVKKVFGYLKQIDSSQYIDELDNEPSNVFVIVHLYQTYIPECVLVNQYLTQMAIKYRYVKFLKIVSTEAKKNYHDAALPSILVYKGGELVISFVPITEELGRSFDKEDLELLFASYDIIPNPMKKTNDWESSLSRQKQFESDSDYDD
ncbi:hypothetical protein DICPUDRAFT_151998 [Dictyostelium purpureum]|uniref:Phosducin domain-containing protein n=1 Tax=Dictyostelium purpureum TaxID=5786 RepID=F0ZK86_DICPU|nr:uncharacterized protein DICPUDRAFT_151998 [Dictyostelium purpureum]EGC35656.1 hypothetical protein DICPUDRAFT_151998 [Dictyostelium purpureum]|eukprot:XP_003287835.1 hypothetical protein DICPUDRAFT_151998 [Dictyostelium purpureum]